MEAVKKDENEVVKPKSKTKVKIIFAIIIIIFIAGLLIGFAKLNVNSEVVEPKIGDVYYFKLDSTTCVVTNASGDRVSVNYKDKTGKINTVTVSNKELFKK